MKQSMSDQIAAAIVLAEQEVNKSTHYPFLETIIRVLQDMQSKVHSPDQTRSKTAGALGYLVLDNIDFAESKLGELLLKLADDFASPDT